MTNEKKKILVITSGFAPIPAVNGGAVETLTTYLIELNEKDKIFEFDIYSVDDRKAKKKSYQNSNINFIKISNMERFLERCMNKINRIFRCKKVYSRFNRKLIKQIKKMSNKSKYDYILFENSMDIFNEVISAFPSTKAIFHLHNDLNLDSKTPQMANIIAKKAYKIIFVSEYLKKRFISLTNCDKEKCAVLYNCMDLSKNQIYDPKKEEILIRKYGINLSKKTFLYIGRLNEEKGILELAKAFAKLKEQNTQLIICGGTWGKDFKKNNYLKKIEEALENVKSNVIFTGYLDSSWVTALYKLTDAVVIPSICNEAFGMVMLEAAFYKKPIIATKSGGMIEIIPDYYEKMVDKDNDVVENLYLAMKKFSTDDLFWHHLVSSAHEYVTSKERFDKNDYLNKFTNMIES